MSQFKEFAMTTTPSSSTAHMAPNRRKNSAQNTDEIRTNPNKIEPKIA